MKIYLEVLGDYKRFLRQEYDMMVKMEYWVIALDIYGG